MDKWIDAWSMWCGWMRWFKYVELGMFGSSSSSSDSSSYTNLVLPYSFLGHEKITDGDHFFE